MAKKPTDSAGEQEATRTRANFEVTSVKEHDAFVIYAELETPSLKEVERILRDKGEKISHTTLWRWAKAGKWSERRLALGKSDHLKLLDLGSAAQALKLLSSEGKTFDIVDSVKGLQSRIVRLMGDKLMEKDEKGATAKDSTVAKPQYYIDMTKLLADLEDVKRRGFQTTILTGPAAEAPEIKKPKAEEKPPEPVPALAKVHVAFPKPGAAKK